MTDKPAHVGDPGRRNADSATIVSEITEWYRRYMTAFSRQDIDYIASEVVAVPYTEITISGEIVIHDGEDAVARQYGAAFEQLVHTGWTRTEIDDIRVSPLSDNVALLVPTVTRYAAGQSKLLDGKRALYLVRRTSIGWRIAAYSYVSDGYELMLGGVLQDG